MTTCLPLPLSALLILSFAPEEVRSLDSVEKRGLLQSLPVRIPLPYSSPTVLEPGIGVL